MTYTLPNLADRWNAYCEAMCDFDSQVFCNDEDFFSDFDPEPMTLLRMAFYGDYRPNDEYVRLDGRGNLSSSDRVEDLIDMDALLRWEEEQNSVQ